MQPPPLYGILRLRGHGNATAGIYSVAHTAPAQPDAAAAVARAYKWRIIAMGARHVPAPNKQRYLGSVSDQLLPLLHKQ